MKHGFPLEDCCCCWLPKKMTYNPTLIVRENSSFSEQIKIRLNPPVGELTAPAGEKKEHNSSHIRHPLNSDKNNSEKITINNYIIINCSRVECTLVCNTWYKLCAQITNLLDRSLIGPRGLSLAMTSNLSSIVFYRSLMDF